MPLDADKSWSRNQVVGLDEILDTIKEVHEIEAIAQENAPASGFRYLDGGEFGVNCFGYTIFLPSL